jgi:hypothetical protein
VAAPNPGTSEAPGNLLAMGPAVRTGALIGYARVSTGPNADLYQLLAYCIVLGLHSGHLVYAKGNEKPQTSGSRSLIVVKLVALRAGR